MEMIWDDVLSAEDRTVIHQAGYEREGAASWDSRSVGSYPALIVIDMQHLAFGPNAPILDAIQTHRTAMGEIAWRALDDILPFVDFCRSKNLPVIFTRVIPHSRTASDPAVGIIEPLQPREGELVLDKNYSSAFYGTGLLTYLNRKRVDTLIVTGNTTSGCVRVTAIDARQMGFHVIVPQECTFDRIQASHKIGLLDLWMKYARVIPVGEAVNYLNSISNSGAESAPHG